MITKEIFFKIQGQFKDKLHFFRIPGVFQDQGHFQGLFKVCANPEEDNETNEMQTQFCLNLLTSRMHYDENLLRHLTNRDIVIMVKVSISQSCSEIPS